MKISFVDFKAQYESIGADMLPEKLGYDKRRVQLSTLF